MKTMSALKATATISAAIVLALFTVQGTLALWTASAPAKSQSVQSADFNVTVAVGNREPQRLPPGEPVTVEGPAGLTPGTSHTTPIVVTNATEAGGTFTIAATAAATATGKLAPYLATSIGLGQGGTCTQVQEVRTLVLSKGASGTFCLTTTLNMDTPVSMGGHRRVHRLHPRHRAAATMSTRKDHPMHAKNSTGAVVPRAIGRTIGFMALIVATLAALVLIIGPLATGSQTYSVLTNSMKPYYGPGALLVIQPTAFEKLKVGDIVTYQIESGRPEVITHRITSIAADQQGNSLLVTRGDNNDAVDPAPVTEPQVRGKLLYAVPFAGYTANWLGNQDRGLVTRLGAIVLIGYGTISIIRALVARRANSRQLTDA